MRKIRDKGIAKLYAAAMRSRKTKKTTGRKAKRGKVASPRGRAKVATVMREFYAGELTTHGRKVPRGRPDIAKAIAMSEGRAISRSKPRRRKSAKRAAPKRRVVKRTAKRRSRPQAQVDHRVIRHAARKAPRKRTETERTALAHTSSRSWASGRMAKRIKKVRSKGSKKPSPAQLAARKKFVEMVRARAKKSTSRPKVGGKHSPSWYQKTLGKLHYRNKEEFGTAAEERASSERYERLRAEYKRLYPKQYLKWYGSE